MPLDPANLTTGSSLNRLYFTALPGVSIPPDMINRSAFDVLSAEAVTQRIEGSRTALALQVGSNSPADLLPTFDRCFEAADPMIRAEAERIALEAGQALGYLLLTLKLGDSASRMVRPNWDETYWAIWKTIDSIWLGGGLVSGNLGQRLATHAQAVMRGAGWADYRVQVSPYKGLMSLVGLARQVPVGTSSALVFDCGGTYIKRGTASYRGTRLVEIRPFARVPAPCHPPFDDSPQEAAQVFDTLLDVISRAYAESPANTIGLSLGCYLKDGQPFDRGCYGSLRLLSDNLGRMMPDKLSKRLGRTVTVMLRHDGTAAAAAHAGTPHSAALMLGTALGVGFPPPVALPITVDDESLLKSL